MVEGIDDSLTFLRVEKRVYHHLSRNEIAGGKRSGC
jgi:hypothetical protein